MENAVINVKVEKTTQNSEKTGFVTKLSTERAIQLPGGMGEKKVKRTYYISVPNQLEDGKEFSLDLGMFNIVERATDQEDEAGNPIMIKWLHLK